MSPTGLFFGVQGVTVTSSSDGGTPLQGMIGGHAVGRRPGHVRHGRSTQHHPSTHPPANNPRHSSASGPTTPIPPDQISAVSGEIPSHGMPRRLRQGITRPQPAGPSSAPAPQPTDAAGITRASEPSAPVLYTAEQAAMLLQVRPSWLRRKAAARAVPCRFLGKHLRFSRADIETIAEGEAPPTRRPS